MVGSPRTFVISAPSGTGKTTLNRRLVSEHPHVEKTITYTTRAIRVGEINGDHYHFVDSEAFHKKIETGTLLEYAEVFGNLYGTGISEIKRIHDKNHIAIMEIDVQGWKQAKHKISDADSIFIIPPSIAELVKRLKLRGTDDAAARTRRLRTAREELASAHLYNHFIVNDILEEAYTQLEGIVIHSSHSRLSTENGVAYCERLLAEFDAFPWDPHGV